MPAFEVFSHRHELSQAGVHPHKRSAWFEMVLGVKQDQTLQKSIKFEAIQYTQYTLCSLSNLLLSVSRCSPSRSCKASTFDFKPKRLTSHQVCDLNQSLGFLGNRLTFEVSCHQFGVVPIRRLASGNI